MPDQNKLAAMAEHEYEIVDSCATCSFGPMQTRYANGWGECQRKRYKHSEHSGELFMPAHVSFKCVEHRRAPWVDRNLGPYASQPWKDEE